MGIGRGGVSIPYFSPANKAPPVDEFSLIFIHYCIRVLVVTATLLLDRVMYGSWINFLKFNFLSSEGDYYGTHPWHWYFTQGFIVMIFTFIPFSAAGIIIQWKLSGLILWVLGIYSLLGHKEFRHLPCVFLRYVRLPLSIVSYFPFPCFPIFGKRKSKYLQSHTLGMFYEERSIFFSGHLFKEH